LRTLYSYVGILSLVVNTSSPFLVSLQYTAYAQEIGVPVEESVPSDAPSEASSEEAARAEETTDEAAPSEEATVGATPAEEPPVTEEVLGTSIEDQAIAETPSDLPAEITADETQQGDILPDGVSDYRPEVVEEPVAVDSAPATEIITDTTDATDPVIEQIEGAVAENEKECLADGAEITNSSTADWTVDSEKGYAETKEPVKLGVKYIFPEEEGVSVTFSCLPKNVDDRSVLRIQEVRVSDLNLPEEFKTDAEFAYDITTDMVNGEFEYDLTLPKPEGVEAEVVYIDKSLEEAKNDTKSEDLNDINVTNQETDKVEIKDINHFSVYVLTYLDNSYDIGTEKTVYKQGEIVYVKAWELVKDSAISYKLAVKPSGVATPIDITSCKKNITSLTETYSLPLDATIGTDWVAQVYRCETSGDVLLDDTIFSVVSVPATTPSTTQTINAGMCMEDAYGGSLNCTANDVSIANATIVEILDDGCAYAGDTVTFTAIWDVQSTATERYNVGLYFATEGQTSALNGTCSVSTLPNSPATDWFDFDGNACGDISSSKMVHPEITITAKCVDSDEDNLLDIPYCTSWHQQVSACSSPIDAIPLNASKCNCEDGFNVPIFVPSGNLTVIKHVINDDGGTKSASDFNITIAGVNPDPPSVVGAELGVSVTLDEGSYTVTEAPVAGYTPSYSSGCSGTMVAGGSATCTITNDDIAPSLTVVKQVTNDDGGTKGISDFGITFSGGSLVFDSGNADGNTTTYTSEPVTIAAGTEYTLQESNVANYIEGTWDCGTPSGDGLMTTFSPILGQSIVCSITNNDEPAPTISVLKTADDNLIPETGQSVTFTYRITNTGSEDVTVTSIIDDVFGDLLAIAKTQNGGADIVIMSTDPDSYYEFTYTIPLSSDTLTDHINRVEVIAVDDDYTQATGFDTETVTFEDILPDITVLKIGSPTTVPETGGDVTFTYRVTNNSVESATITVLSDDQFGVLGGDADCAVGTILAGGAFCEFEETFTLPATTAPATHVNVFTATVTDGEGNEDTDTDDETITFSYVPTLKLVKQVNNTSGGTALPSAWTLTATEVGSGTPTISDPGDQETFHVVTPGMVYTLDEVGGPAGYSTNGWVCDVEGVLTGYQVTLAAEDDVTCTITNDDIAPTLKLVKNVTNDNGGTVLAGGWDLTATGSELGFTDKGDSTTSHTVRAGVEYTLSESTVPGYEAGSWSCDGGIFSGDKITLGLDNDVTCTITNNDRPASIQGRKYRDVNGNGDFDLSEKVDPNTNRLDGWTINLYDSRWELIDSMVTGVDTTPAGPVDIGQYRFVNLSAGTHYVCEEPQQGWVQTEPSDPNITDGNSNCHEVNLSLGQDVNTIQFGNFETASILVCKYVDEDTVMRDDSLEQGAQSVSSAPYTGGWDVDLLVGGEVDDSRTTDETGCYLWEGLKPNTDYSVAEQPRDFWIPNGPTSCDFGNLTSGEQYTCDFHNVQVEPYLYITKENDTGGVVKSPSDTVWFTITVRAENSPVLGVVVRDLLSDGFTFHPSTDPWNVESDDPMRGDITSGVGVTGYNSPGVWEIGDIEAGETITINYQATIDSGIDSGTYKDIAWARGKNTWDQSEGEGSVYAEAIDPGDLAWNEDWFVGTQVKIEAPVDYPEAEAEVDEDEVVEEVLGSSTIRLPATGASTAVTISALVLMSLGMLFIGLSRKKKFVSALPIFLLLGFAVLRPVYASTPDPYLIVRLERPADTYNEPFELVFVAMDTEGGRDLTATCWKDGNDFETISVDQGGGTEKCHVTSGVLGGEGTYQFWVTLSADGGLDPVESNKFTVDYDNDGPDKPKYIEVDRKSDCKYEITIKTANDDQTDYVEVYMSDDKEFTTNENSRIRTFYMGPDEKKTFTEEVGGALCAHRQYFAVRAFDSAGNGSDVEAEEITDIEYKTVYKEGTEEVIQEAYAGGTSSTIGEGTGEEGTEVVLPGEEPIEGEEGSILGEQVEGEPGAEKGFFGKLFASPWTWAALIVLLGGITINGLRKRNE